MAIFMGYVPDTAYDSSTLCDGGGAGGYFGLSTRSVGLADRCASADFLVQEGEIAGFFECVWDAIWCYGRFRTLRQN
jgi:hypothetical protein